MSWKLFLDDERFPVDQDFVVARSTEEAIALVQQNGLPSQIAFDHDLGGADTSIKFIWWMINQYYDHNLIIPSDFTYSIHSQNVCGAANIKGLMDGFLNNIGATK